jgi:hypothetical protein
MMWHFSWIIWRYSIWHCGFIAFWHHILAASCWPYDLSGTASHNVYRHVLNLYKHYY